MEADMAVVRRNIATDAASRDAYVRGVMLLKNEASQITNVDLGIPNPAGGAAVRIATWDLFVIWHVWAMSQATPTGSDRNAAHRGPVFLPWHRWMMLLLEANLQRVLGDPNFGLPYWDWAADGQRPAAQQPGAPVWGLDCMGGSGTGAQGAVTTGPFTVAKGFRVRVRTDPDGALQMTNRALQRRLGSGVNGLPRLAEVADVLKISEYDAPDWDTASDRFRNSLEGWYPRQTAPHLHNRVHVWIGGDMSPASSPNDPVFYLNHCNVDRIWAGWQQRHPAAPYRPASQASADLFRHRLGDPMFSIFTSQAQAARPRDMLNVASNYSYDELP
jgi:tyrosinase